MWSPSTSAKKFSTEDFSEGAWSPPDSVQRPRRASLDRAAVSKPILKNSSKSSAPRRHSAMDLRPISAADFSDDETDFDDVSWAAAMEVDQSRHTQQPRSHSRTRAPRRTSLTSNTNDGARQISRKDSLQRSRSERNMNKSISRRDSNRKERGDGRRSERRDKSRGRGSDRNGDMTRAHSKSRGPSRHHSDPYQSTGAYPSKSSAPRTSQETAPIMPTRTVSGHSRGSQPPPARRNSQSSTLKEFADQLKADIQRKQEQLEQIEAAALVVEGAENYQSMRRDSAGFHVEDCDQHSHPRIGGKMVSPSVTDLSNTTSSTEETDDYTRSRHYNRSASRRSSLNHSAHSSGLSPNQGSFEFRTSFPREIIAPPEMDLSDSSRSTPRRDIMLQRRSQRLLLPDDNHADDTDQSGDDDILSTQEDSFVQTSSSRQPGSRSPKQGTASRRRSTSFGRRGGRSQSRSRRGKSASRRSGRSGRTDSARRVSSRTMTTGC